MLWNRVLPSFVILVDLFMMLSGFGLCAGYLSKFHEKNMDIGEFYKRRYSKILPFFAVTTLIGVIAEHSMRGIAEGAIELTLLFGLLPNNSNCFNVNGICWTMGTIFAFYMLFPFVTGLLKRRSHAWLAFAGSLALQILCELYFTKPPFMVEDFSGRSNILYAMPLFLGGCLAYIYRKEIMAFVRRYQWPLLCLCILASAAYYIVPDSVSGFNTKDLKALAVFGLWLVYAVGARSRLLNNRIMAFVSGISMEIYLSHMIVLRGVRILKIDRLLGSGTLSYVFSYAVLLAGTILFVLIVKRLLQYIMPRLRQRIYGT